MGSLTDQIFLPKKSVIAQKMQPPTMGVGSPVPPESWHLLWFGHHVTWSPNSTGRCRNRQFPSSFFASQISKRANPLFLLVVVSLCRQFFPLKSRRGQPPPSFFFFPSPLGKSIDPLVWFGPLGLEGGKKLWVLVARSYVFLVWTWIEAILLNMTPPPPPPLSSGKL